MKEDLVLASSVLKAFHEEYRKAWEGVLDCAVRWAVWLSEPTKEKAGHHLLQQNRAEGQRQESQAWVELGGIQEINARGWSSC